MKLLSEHLLIHLQIFIALTPASSVLGAIIYILYNGESWGYFKHFAP